MVELGCVVSPLCSSTFLMMTGKFLFCERTEPWKGLSRPLAICLMFLKCLYPTFHCKSVQTLRLLCPNHVVSDCFLDSVITFVWPFVQRKHHAAFWPKTHLTIQHLFAFLLAIPSLRNVSTPLCYIVTARGAKIKAKECRNGLKVTGLFRWFVVQMLMV